MERTREPAWPASPAPTTRPGGVGGRLRRVAGSASGDLSRIGVLVGTLFFAVSLTPSLIPRSTLFQGLVSGLSLAAGYALGAAVRWLWGYLELPSLGGRLRHRVHAVAALGCVALAVGFLWQASAWQDQLRLLVGMAPVEAGRPFAVAALAALAFRVVLALARLFRGIVRALARVLRHVVPRRLAHVLGTAAAVALAWSLVEGVLVSAAMRAADSSFREVDAAIPDEMTPPADPRTTGSAASLVPWADLGRHGRAFVTGAPTAADVGAFLGSAHVGPGITATVGSGAAVGTAAGDAWDGPARDTSGAPRARAPIRVYVGLNAAPTPRARARLALRELVRVGGFERSVLLLVTPTGTGWVDPAAVAPLEFLHRGNVATVAAQYSYLPSPLALVAEGEYGVETARALFEEVYGHWTRLPAARRPRLYLFGVSLGALNSERSFHLHDVLTDPFQGALWAGPPFRSAAWQDVTADRDAGSPAWRPRFRNGAVVRVMNQHGGLTAPGAPWGPLRIAYLQYASDPITFFSVRSAVRRPDWLRPPRGPDVSPALRWYPIVTMLQLAADMAAGANATPPGTGHNFAAEHYIDAWRALTEPDGWRDEDVRRLKHRFRRADAP